MKDDNYNKINEYYNKFREDKRLLRRHGQIEFMTSMHYLEKYLKPGDKIADIGCGTGRYAFELGRRGYDVEAVEYSLANYRVLESGLANYRALEPGIINRVPESGFAGHNENSELSDCCQLGETAVKSELKLLPDLKPKRGAKKHGTVNIHRGDARRLKMFEDETFDAVILFGPLYHLSDHDDKIKALNEAARIVKKDGVIFAAYIMNYYGVLYHGFIEGMMSDIRDRIDDGYHIKDDKENLYSYSTIHDIDRLNEECALISQRRFSQEGPSDYIRRTLNEMDDETFEEFFRWHLANCEKKELLGAGTHVVDVIKKSASVRGCKRMIQ